MAGVRWRAVKGYAFSGNGQGIIRVDVSIDDGKTWVSADLQKPGQEPGRWVMGTTMGQPTPNSQGSSAGATVLHALNLRVGHGRHDGAANPKLAGL